MRALYTLAAILGSLALSSSQLSSGPDGEIRCPETPVNGSYCAGASLSTNIIIRCNGRKGVPGNCNDNLAGIDPIGVKDFAPCYQSSPEAGDAACSYNGTVYSISGTFPVPGYSGFSSKPSYVAPYPTNLAPPGGYSATVGSYAPSSIPASLPPGSGTVKPPSSTRGSIQPSIQPSVGSSVTATGGSVNGSATRSASTSSLPTPLSGNSASGVQSSRWGIMAGVVAAGIGVRTLL